MLVSAEESGDPQVFRPDPLDEHGVLDILGWQGISSLMTPCTRRSRRERLSAVSSSSGEDPGSGSGWSVGEQVAETTDESPARVAMIQRLSWAYLRSVLCPGDASWAAVGAELATGAEPLGRVESK